jgi:MFS family permease
VIFLERWARPLLVVHAISAAVLVAAATHHVVWLRGYFRHNFARYTGERRFALIAAIAFCTTFLVGNLLYPTYKVRVRAEFFDNPAAVAEELHLRQAQEKLTSPSPNRNPPSLSPIARLFDIKEHWVALGCASSLLLLLLSRLAHPREQGRTLMLYLGLALFVCGTAWWGAVVGLVTASFRSVGRL